MAVRATVTSVLGLGEELVALTVYASFAASSGALSVPVLVRPVGIPTVVMGLVVRRRLPVRQRCRCERGVTTFGSRTGRRRSTSSTPASVGIRTQVPHPRLDEVGHVDSAPWQG